MIPTEWFVAVLGMALIFSVKSKLVIGIARMSKTTLLVFV